MRRCLIVEFGRCSGRSEVLPRAAERADRIQLRNGACAHGATYHSRRTRRCHLEKGDVRGRPARVTDVKPEKIERAIADDEAWLAAHPTKRTGNVEACAKRRAFKEAMRQRIKEVAATRDLADEVIRPVLKLKHQEIGRFCQTHSVNIGWLLEGIGPIFKPWPTS